MVNSNHLIEDAVILSNKIKEACLNEMETAYEDALTNGLCKEGAWEVAVNAVQQLDVKEICKTYINNSGQIPGARR